MQRWHGWGFALLFSLVCGPAAAFELLSYPASSLKAGPASTPPVGASVVAVNAAALQSAQPGTPVTLSLPDGRAYTFVLERQVTHAGDSISWAGALQGQNKDFRMVLTSGPEASFGSFLTPAGSFKIETSGGATWLLDMQASGMQRFQSEHSDGIPPPARAISKAGAAPPVAALPPSPQATIDILVLYTPGLVTRIGSVAGVLTRINNLILLSNQAYLDSDIAITLRLLQATQISGVADNTNNTDELYDITDGVGPYTGVGALRDAIGADMVVLMRPFFVTQVSCGVAWIGGYQLSDIAQDADYGYSVVSDGSNGGSYCVETTFPHELGHNMGSMHDRITMGGNTAKGAYLYSYGYGVNSVFTTVMGYSSSFGALPIGRFSNPNQTCMGFTCGVPASDPNLSADNSQSINNTRDRVAAWRESIVHPLAPMAGGQTHAVGAGALPVVRWFDYSPRANRSYELQVLNVATTTALTGADNVARFDALGASQLQDSACLDAGCSTRTLRWIAGANTNERLRIANGVATPPDSSTYTVQLRETTLYCPSWSETGGQSSWLALQRAQSEQAADCAATVFYYDESGNVIASQGLNFPANKVNVQALAAVGGLPGAKGSADVAHTCGIGGLKGIITALEPTTGFSFGTPCGERAR